MSGGLVRTVLRAQGRLPVAQPLLPSRFAPPAAAPSDPLEAWHQVAPEPMSPTDAAPPSGSTRPSAEETSPTVSMTDTAGALLAVRASPAPRDPPVAKEVLGDTSLAARPPGAAVSAFAAESYEAQSARAVAPHPRRLPTPTAAPLSSELVFREPSAAGTHIQNVSHHNSPRARQQAAPLQPAIDASRAADPLTPAQEAHAAERRPPTRRRQPPALRPATAETAATRAIQPVAAAYSVRVPDVHISIGRMEVHAAPARATPPRPAPTLRPQQSLADYLARRK